MSEMQDELIAPCGMNCRLCLAYQRETKHCPGCRPGATRLACKTCRIKNCAGMQESALGFCNHCADYPCRRLIKLDTRYRTKYRMSMLQNLEYISEHGMADFLEREEEQWLCKKCGGILCVHRPACPSCSEPYETDYKEVIPAE